MSKWNKNNAAHRTTWITLYVLRQLRCLFPDAGALVMSDLTYYNKTSGPSVRKGLAEMLAQQVHGVFVTQFGASLEPGKTEEGAVSDMQAVLLQKDKAVLELANVNDVNYRFYKEDEDPEM